MNHVSKIIIIIIKIKRIKQTKIAKKEKGGSGSERKKKRGEREALASLYDSRRSGARFTSGQELKLLYSTKATRGYRNHKFLPRIWTKSSESQKLRV